MNPDPSSQLRGLHAAYCRLTGLEIRFGFEAENLWFHFQREGYTESDLELTINYISKLYFKQPRILAPCLRLHKLIGDLLNFAEYLAEAKKIVRIRDEHAAKESVLRATGRPTEKPKDAVPVSRILESPAFKELVKLKETLK